MSDLKFCSDVAAELGLEVTKGFLPKECCDSCHEDADQGYEGLILYGDDMIICCALLRMMPEEGLLSE